MKDFSNTQSFLKTETMTKLFRFLIVGTLLNLSLFGLIILLNHLGVGYDFSLLVTNVLGLILNFILNRIFVFKDRTQVITKIIYYGLLYASVYGLQLILYRAFFSFGIFHDYFSILLTVAITANYSFIMLDKVVFVQENKNQSYME